MKWFEQAFDEEYMDLYLHRDLREAARAVRFLRVALALAPEQTVLDLCCGPGRHLHFLGREVRRAVGLDLSPALLRRAAQHWLAEEGEAMEREMARREALLVRGTMRRLPFADACFDRVVNLFTSFGYFEEESENQAVLAEIGRVLAAGGILAIDHINRQRMLAELQARSERGLSGGRRLEERREWNVTTRRIEKHVKLSDADGRAREWMESVRVYAPEELEAMLRSAGLEPAARHGDYDGSAWGPGAPRLIVLARKRESERV